MTDTCSVCGADESQWARKASADDTHDVVGPHWTPTLAECRGAWKPPRQRREQATQ